jgi:hypothetical protein
MMNLFPVAVFIRVSKSYSWGDANAGVTLSATHLSRLSQPGVIV